MISPVETIADALIAFILSLLNDPEAADEFVARPQQVLAEHGLQGACLADVRAVKPVIVDHPDVDEHHNPPPPPPGEPSEPGEPSVVNEIVRMIQQYTTIDARSTVVDQSVNQNIWTEGGDVTQLFDQEAVVASGDDSIAAGDDVSVVDSDTDVSMGDVAIGNESNQDSFNTTGADADDMDAAAATTATPDGTAADADGTAAAVTSAVDAAVGAAESTAAAPADAPAAAPADVPEPADLLESDMTTDPSDSYTADAAAAGAALDDQPMEVPSEDD